MRNGMGIEIMEQSVVLTNGNFLNGIIHIGEKIWGRQSWRKSRSRDYRTIGRTRFESGRMKTGTPTGIDACSIKITTEWRFRMAMKIPGRFSYTDTPPIQTPNSPHHLYQR